MTVVTGVIKLETSGNCDIVDISSRVSGIVEKSGIRSGIVSVLAKGSTAAITTTEFESNLNGDLKELFEKLVPSGLDYRHHNTWQDDNGHSHLRASIVGCSETFPFSEGRLMTGTWQQIILIDFDTSSRSREVIVSVIG